MDISIIETSNILLLPKMRYEFTGDMELEDVVRSLVEKFHQPEPKKVYRYKSSYLGWERWAVEAVVDDRKSGVEDAEGV